MALIDPKGLLYGERLGDCSDEAQLHWPRLFAASNGYGRIELSVEHLNSVVYSSFKKKPTAAFLSKLFDDYAANWLLFIYQAEDASIWGQWITSEKFLPHFKTNADKKSPAPDFEALEEYKKQYISSRKAKYLCVQRFHKSSKQLATVSPSSGVGVGAREGTNTPPPTREAAPHEPPSPEPRPPEPEAEPEWDENAPPPGLPMLAYSRGMLETLCIPLVMATEQAGAAAIGAFAKERGLEKHRATAELTRTARDALDRGEQVDKWWFTDSKWRKKQEVGGGANTTNRGRPWEPGIYTGPQPTEEEIEQIREQVEAKKAQLIAEGKIPPMRKVLQRAGDCRT